MSSEGQFDPFLIPAPEPPLAPKIPGFDPWPPRDLIPPRWPIKYGPATIKVLIVVDGIIGYDRERDFGLGLMLRDAFNPAHPEHPAYARFEFTLAHRTSTSVPGDITPGFTNFTFSEASLAGFHEVWLFGIIGGTPYIQGAELDAIINFMNQGGGVLAMGDHEDLGLGLCGNVPRVKSMRKWWFDDPLPPGEPRAPDISDLTRNDTVQLTGGQDPGQPGEEDGVPQPIYPVYRHGRNWWNALHRFRYPHPILCGPRGAIRVFPDHPHEGDCVVPPMLDAAQYPGGVAPEVIAHGRNVVGRTKAGHTITEPRPFGLLGTYDGHLPAANVGRIVVDSTWHHWFNMNLMGLGTGDISQQSASYRDILAYFRNVAVWLAPKERHERMRKTGQVISLYLGEMMEIAASVKDLARPDFYWLGIHARDALGRLAPRCQVDIWLRDILIPHLPKLIERELPMTPGGVPERWHAFVTDQVLMTALGGATAALALATRRGDHLDVDSVIDAADRIAAEGVQRAVRRAYAELDRHVERLRGAVAELRADEQ